MEDDFDGAKFLLEKGADPHIEDHIGNDTCDYARTGPLYEEFE